MALKFPQIKFLSNIDAKSRMFLLFAAVVGVSLAVYLAVYFFGNATTTATARVANAPKNLVSVPGGDISPEYQQTLEEANLRRVEEARLQGAGASAIPTVINVGSAESNCFMCPNPDTPDVNADVETLMNKGKLSREAADMLKALANRNASVDEYAAALDALVKAGKLTPEEARALLEKYKKQHANAMVNESAKMMDGMIKSGKLPLTSATELLELQKNGVTPGQYAGELQHLVDENKITPDTAGNLLAQYTQQLEKEGAKRGLYRLQQMAKQGQITPDVLQMLTDLQNKNVPVNEYTDAVNKLINDGKVTPAVANKLIQDYRARKVGGAMEGPLAALAGKGGLAAELAKHLLNLQANNASASDYANELKKAVQSGVITPVEATALMQQYQASIRPTGGGAVPGTETVIPEYAALQERIQEASAQNAVPEENFENVKVETREEATDNRLQRIQDLQAAMGTQADSLFKDAWLPPVMVHQEGTPEKVTEEVVTTTTGGPGSAGAGVGSESLIKKPALIKSGVILFGVLDTAVDSDYPDTPVMVTIIEGKFKGAKLLGKLSLAPGQDKVSLNFTQMDQEDWPSAKTISAYAIDPDTARTVMASEVDHHYLAKYGTIMATSFLQGYSNAITNAGTSTTGIFGTSTDHPSLSPGSKFAVGLGQIGTNLNELALQNLNKPTTVKINAGVGLGILFASEVTDEDIPPVKTVTTTTVPNAVTTTTVAKTP